MRIVIKTLLATVLSLSLGGIAEASPIEYIFTGDGTGDLNGTSFDGSFTVTFDADTAGISLSGGEYSNDGTATFSAGALTATFTGNIDEVLDNTATPGYVGFAQVLFPPLSVSVEAITGSPFETYDLATALSLTAGTISPPTDATFETSAGNLDFDDISSMSFQADTVPEPASLALLGSAFAAFAAFCAFRRRTA
jgi:hypothetical protein